MSINHDLSHYFKYLINQGGGWLGAPPSPLLASSNQEGPLDRRGTFFRGSVKARAESSGQGGTHHAVGPQSSALSWQLEEKGQAPPQPPTPRPRSLEVLGARMPNFGPSTAPDLLRDAPPSPSHFLGFSVSICPSVGQTPVELTRTEAHGV